MTVPRIVVRPPNWLGDAVMALPAMAAIRRHFNSAHITLAATPPVAALLREENNAAPDAVVDLPKATREAVRVLRDREFDIGILLPNSWRSAWQFHRAGIAERWGYGTSFRGPMLTRHVARVRTKGVLHQADYYRHLVTELGIEGAAEISPWIAPRSATLREADALLERGGVRIADAPIAAIAPGAAYGQAKQWPPDRMAAVAAGLAADRGVTCVLVGADHDRDAGRAVESWIRAHAPAAAGRVVNLVGRTSMRALVGVLSQMAVVVANDSGSMHLAAALGRPVVALFGPTDERATRPIGDHHVLTATAFCRPCMLRDCPIDHRCMKRISVERVLDAVDDVLARRVAH
jgi:heptosyltransferase-2